MADNDLEITFGADTAALTAGTTVAVGDINKIVQAIALLQKTVGEAARVTTSELTAAITGMGSQAGAQAPRVRQMAQEVERLSTAGHSGHGTIFGMRSGVFLELRALLDEALSGRMRNFEGSFARLLGMIGPNIAGFVALNPVISALGVAAAGSAGYLAYLAIELYKVKEAQDTINTGVSFSGNFKVIDPKVLEDTRRQLESLKGIFKGLGEDDVAKITSEFARMGNASNEVIGAMTADMTNFWKAFGGKEEESAKTLVEVFSNPLAPIDKIAKSLNGLSEEERKFISDAQAANNPLQAQAAIQQVIAQRSTQYHSQRIAQINAEIAADRARQATTLGGDRQTRNMLQEHIDMLEKEKAGAKNVDDTLAGWADKIRAAITSAQMLGNEFRALIDEANKVGDAYDRIGATARKLSNDSTTLFAGIFQSVKAGDLGEAGRLLGALPKLVSDAQVNRQQGADPLGLSRDAIKQAEDGIKQWQATTGASQDAVRAHSAQIWKQMASDSNLSIAQQHDAYQKYLDQVIAGNNAAAKGGAKAAKDELGATEQGIDGQIAEIERQTGYETKHYEVMVKLHQMTEDQKAKATIDALQKEQTAIDALYAKELALGGLSLTKRQEILNKELAENDKVAEMMYEAQAQAAEKAQKAWDGVTKTINSAIDSQVNGLLKGSENFRTAMKNIAASIIEAQIKTGLNSLLTGIEGVGGKALGGAGQGNGIMSALMAALGLNTVATTANTTATAASSGGGSFGILGGIGHLFGFATGTPYVQQTGLAMIHKGERIVPANLNSPEGMQDMMAGGGGGGSSGGDVTHNHNWNLHLPNVKNGSDFGDWLKSNPRALMDGMNRAVGGGHHLGFGNLRS